ncbi:type 1 periplasmic-binding domain-containing protein, partial [Hymenobacter ruricola]
NFDCPLDEDEYRARTGEALAQADCAIHLLGNEFGRRFEEDEDCSFPMFAYREARRQAEARPAFRQFVWYCPDEALAVKPAQQSFVATIRNELNERCTFTNAPNAMQLVEDLRSTLGQVPTVAAGVDKETDIFFVYNAQDSEEANAITDRLSEEYPLEILTIEPDSEDAYKDLAVSAIPKSRLAVVYFKHSADWALPFVKQVWRLVGGAGSTTPILFVGEDDPVQNKMHGFKAPKVISRIQPHLGVSEEVRRVFQQLNTNA